MKFIITAIASIALASCEGITAKYQGDTIDAEYSSKGGLIIYPKAPAAIQVIEGTK